MPLLTNFVPVADILLKAAEFQCSLANIVPMTDIDDWALDLLNDQKVVLNWSFYFKQIDQLEAWAWKNQAEMDENKKWLPHNGKATAAEFAAYLTEKSAGNLALFDGLKLLLEEDIAVLKPDYKGDKSRIPRYFFLVRCAKVYYGL